MPENQNEEQKKFFKSVTTVKLKDRPIFKGSIDVLKGIGYNISNLVGVSKEKESIKLYADKSGLLKSLEGELKNISLLDDMAWDTLSNSDKQVVLNLVKDIQELSGINVGVDHIESNTKEVLSKCLEVVGKVGDQVKSIASMGSFSHNDLKDLLAQIDKGSIDYYHQDSGVLIPSKDDLDIVSALKMTGIDLQFDGTKWELNTASNKSPEVSFVPQKDGKPLQVFGNDNIQFLLNNYLNIPQEQRQQTVVPSKLLQVYVNEYERQMLEGKDPSTLEAGLIRRDVARQRKIFSMDSNEFKITKMLDRDTIMRNAQKMGIANAFEAIVAGAKDTSEISENVQDIITSISSEPAYRDLIKGLNKLVPMLERTGDKFEDAIEFEGGYNEDFIAEYDQQIEYLNRTNGNLEQIDALNQAKKEFIEAVTVQQVYWQSKLVEVANSNKGNIYNAELAGAINESMGFAVQQKNGEFVMANGESIQKFLDNKNLSTSLYTQLKDRAQKKGANKNANVNINTTGITQYPEIFFDYAGLIAGVDFSSENNFVVDYSNLRLYQSMWQDGCFFDLDFTKFKKQNPQNATLEAYVKNFATGQAPEVNFDPELITDAYYIVHPKDASKEQLNKAQSKINAFNNHLLLSDLMLKQFSPDDIMKYDNMVDGVKSAFLNKKYQEAVKAFQELEKDPVKYKEALDKAKKRHEAGIVGSVINQKWSEAAMADNEKGQGPLISSAVDAFLNACGKTQKKNNAELQAEGEPIINNGEPTAEQGQESAKNGNKKEIAYGKMFPSGPNVNKFLKLMKPYSAKAITKYFVEPLMADIEAININIDAYYAKVASIENVDFTKEKDNIVKITQRDFEASAFMPGAVMFEHLAKQQAGDPVVSSLGYLFNCLSSTDKEQLMGNVVDGKDYRDALRELAIGVCGKTVKINDNKELAQMAGNIMQQYNIQDTDIIQKVRTGFAYVTPEMLAYAFEPCSKLENGKLTVGSELPVDKLIKCQNDAQRKQIVFENCDMNDSYALLNDLVGKNGIYYTAEGAMDTKAINQGFDRQSDIGKSIPQMAELMKLRDAMKAKGMEVPKYLEQPEAVAEDDSLIL